MPRTALFAIFMAGLFAATSPSSFAEALTPRATVRSPSGGDDAAIYFSRAFERILYAHPDALVRGVAPDGANGVNAAWEHARGPGMFIEEQRHGEEAIIAGIVSHRPVVWRLGLREIEWGFTHQGPGGDFPQTQDRFHSTSFFVEGVAHLTLVLRAAARNGVAIPGVLLRRIDKLVPRLHAAARWMISPGVWTRGLADDAPYTHRRFLVATALGLTSLLTSDGLLGGRAHDALELGIKAQLRDGVDPELGGSDSSYQARGLVYAEQYLAWTPAAPQSLVRTIARGLRWERTRILRSGKVSIAGNTRANGIMADHNGRKKVVYPMVATAFAWWGLARHVRSYVTLGSRVSAFGEAHPAEVGI